ncbi:YdcF family protein [Actinomyces sp.]|uniref:YdcF family protein n=1 Tax=Actinomyces sp. TaxID=29317 RepID=UPI0026DC43E1|nr:YdcF family protein [Actinomyces sp.]MDO4900061.1 YdcF family protein [Actinomyces sp.]
MVRIPCLCRSVAGACVLVIGAVALGEVTRRLASSCLLNDAPSTGDMTGTEVVLVLGHADAGSSAGAENRRRVRAGLRNRTTPTSLLVLSGGAVAGPVPEAELMARYATEGLGYSGPIVLEDASRSTWENIAAAAPMIEAADRIIVVSEPVHALKARLFLRRQYPNLAARLVRADDYRLAEGLARGPGAAMLGLIDLALSACLPGWAQDSATGLAGVRRLLAYGRFSLSRKRPSRSSPSEISSVGAA